MTFCLENIFGIFFRYIVERSVFSALVTEIVFSEIGRTSEEIKY